MAVDHARTEEMIKASGLPYAILRNGSYIENYTGFVGFWLHFKVPARCWSNSSGTIVPLARSVSTNRLGR